MRFAIRDDDTNYFTQPEDLERAYGTVWESCPVSLSVVPFQACTRTGAVPRDRWEGDAAFPVGENPRLVDFLKRKIAQGRISINQHGYSHRDFPDGYEFEAGDDLARKAEEGKRYLEDLFEAKVDAFVPPHNALNRRGWEAVLGSHRRLLGPLPQKPWTRPRQVRNAANFLRWRWFCLRKTRRWGPSVAYPFPLDYGRYHEFICTTLTPEVPLARLRASLDAARKAGGDFCLAVHYWEFEKPRMAETFRQFWQEVKELPSVEFVHARRLFPE